VLAAPFLASSLFIPYSIALSFAVVAVQYGLIFGDPPVVLALVCYGLWSRAVLRNCIADEAGKSGQ
jgi:hypothetical protein